MSEQRSRIPQMSIWTSLTPDSPHNRNTISETNRRNAFSNTTHSSVENDRSEKKRRRKR